MKDLVSEEFAHQVFIQNKYHTHTSYTFELIHKVSELILYPSFGVLRCIAYVIAPDAGEYKDHPWWKTAVRAGALAGLAMLYGVSGSPYFKMTSLMLGVLFPMLGYTLRWFDFKYRPLACYLVDSSTQSKEISLPAMTKENPLHIRTHNQAFVPFTVAQLTNVRDRRVCAKELVASILKDPKQPKIIFCQEAPLHNEDAIRIFVEGLKKKYPYIIYNVAPSFNGYTSGDLVLSQFPLKFESFHPFKHMVWPHDAPLRGILIVSVETKQGKVMMADVHTQSLAQHAKAREKQLLDLHTVLKDMSEKHKCPIMVVGDFNTSRINASGGDNLAPSGQPEEPVLKLIEKLYKDPFLKDHDPITGERTQGKPIFLETDDKAMDVPIEEIKEPNGTWYYEASAGGNGILYQLMKWLANFWNKADERQLLPATRFDLNNKNLTWGTSRWKQEKSIFTARFDMILFPKHTTQSKMLDANVEIRHIIPADKNQQSPSTDHAPVDAHVWFKY